MKVEKKQIVRIVVVAIGTVLSSAASLFFTQVVSGVLEGSPTGSWSKFMLVVWGIGWGAACGAVTVNLLVNALIKRRTIKYGLLYGLLGGAILGSVNGFLTGTFFFGISIGAVLGPIACLILTGMFLVIYRPR
ncbi:MAG: hypothetical protein V2A72_06925 [Candidatus Omnitrophota bacterium]